MLNRWRRNVWYSQIRHQDIPQYCGLFCGCGNVDKFIVLLILLFIIQWVNADKYACAPVIMTMTIDKNNNNSNNNYEHVACVCECILLVVCIDDKCECIDIYVYVYRTNDDPTNAKNQQNFWRQRFNWSELEPFELIVTSRFLRMNRQIQHTIRWWLTNFFVKFQRSFGWNLRSLTRMPDNLLFVCRFLMGSLFLWAML